jgi:hypothetical protein
VRISEELRFKKVGESWKDYCERLWIGCWEQNGTDTIKLTLHLGELAEAEFRREKLAQAKFRRELNLNYEVVKALMTRVDGNSDGAEKFAEGLKDTLFGIKVAFDLVEF